MIQTALVPRKWRPKLGLVVIGVLVSVLVLPIAVLFWLRLAGPAPGQIGVFEIGLFVLALGIALVLAYVLTRTITSPLRGLTQRADAIAHGGREAVVPLVAYGTEETALLAERFYDLALKLLNRSAYVQSFATHVSHEFKSPLTAIRGAAELLSDDLEVEQMSRAERQIFLNQIVEDVDRLSLLMTRLRELGIAEQIDVKGTVTLRALVQHLKALHPGLTVDAKGPPEAVLPLNRQAAETIFGQLAGNAVAHGAARLQLSIVHQPRQIEISFSDDGPGITADIAPHIFEPFFTTRREQGGTGMGLHIVRAMLAANGGGISLEQPGAGTTFTITLPEG